MYVTASRKGDVVHLRVLQSDGSVATTQDAATIATLNCKPVAEVNQLIGVQDGAWLILHIGVDGIVSLYHVFHDGVLTWALLDASTAFLVA